MAYSEYGAADNPRVLICVHGLTRASGDFETLARRFHSSWRIICPDVVGRGRSSWLKNPAAYQLAQYAADMTVLIARLNVPTVHWLGTSMGGLIGLVLAGSANSVIRSLVLNDVGPAIEMTALQRIAAYVGQAPAFATLEQAEHYLRGINASFGAHTDEQWRQLTLSVTRVHPDGNYRLHYDPTIANSLRELSGDQARIATQHLWNAYDAIVCPTLLLRGAKSDLLSSATALEMQKRGPAAQYVEFAGVGHAPMLMQPDQLDALEAFWAHLI